MCRAAVGYGLSKMLAKGRMKFRACDTGFANHWKVTMSKSKPQELMSWAQQSVLTKQGQSCHVVTVLSLVLCQQLQAIDSVSFSH